MKKDVVETKAAKGSAPKDETMMIVSGRSIAAYYPVTESHGSIGTYSPATGDLQAKTEYDAHDRTTGVTLADGSVTRTAYSIGSHDGEPMLQTTVTDALGRHAESYTDAKGRNRETVQHARGEDITVKYSYDPVGQVMTVQHPNGRETKYAYDLLGRKLMVNHPDAGETDMTYDAAGNLLTKLTAELRKSISDKGYISYTYDFERLHEVLYPENLFNRVTYTYGKAGDKYNRAGRLALVEDASGGEAYYYGCQGEVTKTVRTVMASVADIRTYVYGATYDSWNRVQTMTYPDGEVVTYHYNAAGQVERLTSNKQGRQSVIVDRIGYDKEGHTVYTKLGNGTETTYTYDKQRERLQMMNLTADGQTVMENRYRYDAVDNILGITNAANPTSLTKLNRAKLGGRSMHTYEYDELNRLIHASGKAKHASYDMVMSFGRMSEPLTKVQKVDSTTTAKSYNFAYKYEDSNHPTAPTQIGHDHYTYDANGNPTLVTNDSTNTTREMYWDEDNRLMVLSDNGKTSRYTYNAAGERIMKSYGTMEGVYINGAPQGITFHETDNFTLYPASILSVNKNRFTKHYFIGDKRVASRIGTGLFNNVYGRNGSYVTAGQQDYAERMNQIQKQKEAYYKQQGIAPGVPTMKGAYGDPENTKRGYNSIIDTLGNHDVPQGWIQTPRPNTTPNTNPGPPVSWNDPTSPDDPQAGYGYIPNDTTREETFFYHSDHLGSTSYITDDKGNITQYDAYLPYGELLVDEHSSSEDMPYKFNGKEMDSETGLYYYGARYLNPVTSLWYGVDPLAEKYVTTGGYVYTLDNPVKLVDPDGKKWTIHTSKNKDGKTNVNITVTGVVYNSSRNKKLNLSKIRDEIAYQIKKTYSFSSKKYHVRTNVSLRVVNSVDDINSDDHVFELVDQSRLGKKSILANSDLSGLHIRIGPRALSWLMSGFNTRTVPHELGHTAGFPDANISNIDKVNLLTNIMSQTGYLRVHKVGNYMNTGMLSDSQIAHMINSYDEGLLNQHSPISHHLSIINLSHGILSTTFNIISWEKRLAK
nr:RHS repeat-associated core domain-containing protein [Prevotella denticola]